MLREIAAGVKPPNLPFFHYPVGPAAGYNCREVHIPVARLKLSFLGPPRIEIDGQSVHLDTRKAVALLAYLAVTGEPASRDAAVTLLWARYGRIQGQAALRRTLTTLRKELAADWLSIERDQIALRPSAEVWIDVDRVRELRARCADHRHSELGVCRDCQPLLGEAAGLFRGEFLLGFTLKDSLAFDDWQFFLTEDFRLQRAEILRRLALCLSASGDHEGALACARRRLDIDPLDESAHTQLMLHYAWAGNRTAALRQYEECATILRREMEGEPGREIELVREAIRRGQAPSPPVLEAPSRERSAPTFAAPSNEPVGRRPPPSAAVQPPSPRAWPSEADRRLRERPPPTSAVERPEAASIRPAADRFEPFHVEGEGALPFAGGGQEHAGVEEAKATVVVARIGARTEGEVEGASGIAALFAEIVAKYRGKVMRVCRNEAVASFSDPSLAESNPEIAVRAALEISERAIVSGMRIQVAAATGELALPPAGQGEGAPTYPAGKGVILASLLAERSTPGMPFVAERTYRHTRAVFAFGEPTIRSVAAGQQVVAYPVLGLAPLSHKTRGIEGARVPLIGREEEVRRLFAAYDRAADGKGQVAVVTGEAGIGKSRLIAELRDYVRDGRRRSLWLEGRCLTPTATIGYWPFTDLLRALEAQQGPVDELLSELVSAGQLREGESAEIAAVLDDLSGTPFPHGPGEASLAPEQLKQRIFAGIQSFFRALAGLSPLVLIFEDLHWADELSLELVEGLMGALKGCAALLACVYRSDPAHRSRRLAGSAAARLPGELLEIRLREMTREESERMFDALVSGQSPSAAEREGILRRSQGNPFFLEELVRAFADRLPLPARQDRGSSAPVLDPKEDGELPEEITAVLLSRLHALPPLHRETLECASVIGRVFRRRLLELAMGRGDLSPALEDLEERELLFVERTLPEIEYSFKHVLAQEAFYDDLSPPIREGLHRRVAAAYERASAGGSDEHCEQLARHLDLGGLADKAIEHYYRSGERARSLYANEAAVSHLSRGLELLRDSARPSDARPDELDFLIALGVPLVLLKGHHASEVEAVYLRAREIAARVGTPDQLFQVTLGLHRLYFSRGEHRKTSEVDEEMIELGRRLHDPILTSRAHMMLGETLFTLGDFPRVLQHVESGYDLYRPEEHRLHLVQFGNDTGIGCLLLKAEAQWTLGYACRALQTVSLAVERSRELSNAFTLVFALYNAALVAFMRREPDRALVWAEECARIARTEGFRLYVGLGPVVHGWALGMLGGEERGIKTILEGLEVLPQSLPFRVLYASMLAELWWRKQRLKEALDALDGGFEVVRGTDAHAWESELNRLRAKIGLDAGESEVDAERWLQRSLKAARRQGARSLELRAALDLCRLKRAGPEAVKARERLASIYGGFTEGFDTVDLIEARQALEATPPDPSLPR